MSDRRQQGSGATAAGGDMSLFLGARLMTLVNLMRRTTALRFQRLFGLSLVDGWVISRLGGAEMSLDELAYRSGLAKSQMSRSVTNMVRRKLVSRTRNPVNKSEVVLKLTDAGRAIHDEIMRRTPEYNRLLTTGLTDGAVAVLTDLVQRLVANSRRNLRNEQDYGRETSE